MCRFLWANMLLNTNNIGALLGSVLGNNNHYGYMRNETAAFCQSLL